MSENRKYFVNNIALFVTARTEEGLPIVPTLGMNFIIWGILARARDLYQVRICHFVFLANHMHMVLVVENPEHVSEFVGYIKAEIAHAINRLLGRRRRTVWAEGYDSPVLLTPEDVVRYIKYLYLNPAKAALVDSIKEYPGVNSWEMFVGNDLVKNCAKVPRNKIAPMSLPAQTIAEQRRTVDRYIKENYSEFQFKLEPWAWINCFSGMLDDIDRIKRELLEVIEEEIRLKNNRNASFKFTLGATALRRQSMSKEYQPKKFGKKMICLCSDRTLRHAFIAVYRELCVVAREVYDSWKRGELAQRIPPGLLPPRMPSLVSAISLSIDIV